MQAWAEVREGTEREREEREPQADSLLNSGAGDGV